LQLLVNLWAMEKYELAMVLSGKVTAAKKKSVLAEIEKVVKILKGKFGKIDEWGVKELAYPIKKNDSGFFVLINLEFERKYVKQFDSKLRMNEDIIRYLIIKI